ncbi:hypothetical protein [Actinacidiphila rubida]|uniref:hypothetical protein n=1 Tax=Actinacidiphila rubida TaxID=310780 RepID=UPI000945B499|nr:hypothetical protein [Actinacidiphila rubida]
MLTEDFLQHRVIPGIAAFARRGLPEPATTDDDNAWTDGYCWLFCGQQWTRVLWIGPASIAGAQAPMYACGPCIHELHERIWQAILLTDDPSIPAHADTAGPQEPRARQQPGRHRRRRHRL